MAGRRRKKGKNIEEAKMVKKIKELEAYEQFKEMILPFLQQDLLNDTPAEEILKKYQSYAAARLLTIAATEQDSSKAIAAVKQVLDRAVGLPTQKQEVTHKYDQLTDDELDAILATEISKLDENSEEQQH